MIDWQGLRATAGVSILLQAGRHLGMSESQCLRGTSLDLASLDEPLASIESWQEMALIRNIQAFRQSDQVLGIEVGQGYSLETIGPLGQAMAACESLLDALTLTERYRWFGLSFSDYRFTADGSSWVVEVLDDEVPRDCRRFCQERGLMGAYTLFANLLKAAPPVISVSMKCSEPEDREVYRQAFGVDVVFCADTNRIAFDQVVGDMPLPLANPSLKKMCEAYCDEMLLAQIKPRTFRGKVETQILNAAGGISLVTIAHRLGISDRQLRRNLSSEGVSFRQLLLQYKLSSAQKKLSQGHSVDSVARALGYAESASFSRIFKQQLGVSPKQFQLRHALGNRAV
ncbi:MAG: AraC family transcriptional regulator ligand-binding domain-containing protein [Cellvibrionaceae bacterium]